MSKRALISVSDKTGVLAFSQTLVALGYEILSTGGTKAFLEAGGVPVTGVESVTQFPECMDGRVKTLHPMIHGGLLGDLTNPGHVAQMESLGIQGIDLLYVNLYPFKSVYQNPDSDHTKCIENIDIGGPTMLRSAAKNYKNVLVLTDAGDLDWVGSALKAGEPIDEKARMALALKVFETTAAYDALIARYFTEVLDLDPYRDQLTLTFEKAETLRYGENPHQKATLYREIHHEPSAMDARQIHGKALSFNNYLDLNAAVELVREFVEPAAVAIKHNVPCGIGVSTDVYLAYQKAYSADPQSIFGGIVALNRPVDVRTAQAMHEIFLEIIIAPAFHEDALAVLQQKKNLRLMVLENLLPAGEETPAFFMEEEVGDKDPVYPEASRFKDYKRIAGGLLVQDRDQGEDGFQVVSDRLPGAGERAAMKQAMKVVKHIKSNGIVLFKDGQMIGVGSGQTSRIWAVENAIDRSLVDTHGAIMASDAFFPFPDSVERAAQAGITAIIHPGGSANDQAVIDAANKYGIAMVITGVRHFKH